MKLHEVEGYDEVMDKLLQSLPPKQRLSGLGVAERLEGLGVAERLEGLGVAERLEGVSAEELVLNLPDDMLRALSADYIEALPAEVRDRVRARIAR